MIMMIIIITIIIIIIIVKPLKWLVGIRSRLQANTTEKRTKKRTDIRLTRQHTNSGRLLITANSKGMSNRQSRMEINSEQSKLFVEGVIIHISHGKKYR
jgi:exosome complex RNA-binding protein Rrp4